MENELVVGTQHIKCDTFICYRGESSGTKASMEIAEKVFNAINGREEFGYVFYAEKIPYTYDFIGQAESLIKTTKCFIIVLCNNFFKNFFADENGIKVPFSESATCKELQLAFKYKCKLYPIFTSEFAWDNIDSNTMKNLYNIFGQENINLLRHRSDALRWNQTGINEDKIIEYLTRKQLENFTWSGKSIIETKTGKPEIEDLKQKIMRIYDLVANRCIKLHLNDLEMDWGAYQSLKKTYGQLFYIPSGYINGIKSLQKNINNSFVGLGYRDIKRRCGLKDSNVYYYWPIECTAPTSNQTKVSICGICFGILMLNSWLYEDMDFLNAELPGVNEYELEQTIQGALNLLITLRDYEHFSWMSTWEFNDTGVAGTINQTTLSLSTLINYGFLNEETISKAQLENRFIYISESIHWLLEEDLAKHNNNDRMYWGEIHEGEEIISYALTCFCFDVLLKYLRCIIRIKDKVGKTFKKLLTKEHKEIYMSLNKVINQFLFWCSIKPNTYSKKILDNQVTNISRMLYSMTQYVICIENNMEDYVPEDLDKSQLEDNIKKIKNLIKVIVSDLLSIDIDYFHNLDSHEIFEEFIYIKRKSWRIKDQDDEDIYEIYENCSELIYMDSLISAVPLIDDYQKEKIHKKVSELLCWFEKTYVRMKENHIVIRGKRTESDLVYPLYALYYYRALLHNYLKLWG